MKKKRSRKAIAKTLEEQISQKFLSVQIILKKINIRARLWAKSEKKNKDFIKFDDLYSLLSNEGLLVQALGNIQRNKGSLTPGVSKETIDKISLKKIQDIATELKSGKFKFSPVRRKLVPKQKNMLLEKLSK